MQLCVIHTLHHKIITTWVRTMSNYDHKHTVIDTGLVNQARGQIRSLKDLSIFIPHFSLQMLNLSICALTVLMLGVVKMIVPVRGFQRGMLHCMHKLYFQFGINSLYLIKRFNKVTITVQGAEQLSREKWYLLVANHQSYLDIIVLIEFCAQRMSPPKFFLKKELLWLPFVGLGAWALDMPFMQRASKKQLAKDPTLRTKDIETTKAYCARYREYPTTIINFVEGTRCNDSKIRKHNSPFHHLLRPKAGGIALSLGTMGQLFDNILNLTLIYPGSREPMWDMLCGRLQHIIIDVESLEVNDQQLGDYQNDSTFRISFQSWLNTLWQHKDRKISELLSGFRC